MPRRMHETRAEEEDEEAPRPSRGALKRDAELRERMGKELTALPPERLALVPLPDDLKEAIADYGRISARGGGRRQLQYIGRLMRDVDIEPVKQALEELKQGDREEARVFQLAERWRARLLEEEGALDELSRERPEIDRDEVARLVEQARLEEARGRPPSGKRALFRLLREVFGNRAPR